MVVLYFRWAGLDSGFCCLLVFPLSRGVGVHLSATRRTRIDVQHSLGIQLLLHFKLQGQRGRNSCQSCQAQKHETNSPRRGCVVKHRDKGQKSRHESLGLCLHMWNQVIYRVVCLFFVPFGVDSSTLTTGERIRQIKMYLTWMHTMTTSIPVEEKAWAGVISASLCPLFMATCELKSHTNSSHSAASREAMLWSAGPCDTLM